jgi:GT2 family glycosyltransferase
VVVDDGSQPPLRLPQRRPVHCRLVRAPEHSTGWGRANALHVGVSASDGEILHWLDADLVPFPEHVEAQARWHHAAEDAVTLGYKRFVPHAWPSAAEIGQRAAAGTLDALFPPAETEPHDYVEELIEATDQLRAADHLAFRAHVGATAALRRELYEAAGGLDTALRLGEDSEFGYRLAQAGAVFVPEPRARSWHLGPSHAMRQGERLRRHNWPYLADRMPHPRWLRGRVRRSWTVPLAVAVVQVGGAPLELVRGCVDRLLDGDEYDLRVELVGDWKALTDDRRPVLDDPQLDLRLVAQTYRGEPRVSLVERESGSAFPSPYRLRVPVELGVAAGTVSRLIQEIDRERAGLVRLVPAGAGAGPAPPTIELWRTAAVSRARRRLPDQLLADAVTAVWGGRWITGTGYGVTVLSAPAGAPVPGPGLDGEVVAGRGPGRRVLRRQVPASPVPVAGLRSLLKATGYVGRLAADRARYRLRTGRG